MTDFNGNGGDLDQRLNDALVDYMQSLDRGEVVDREAFLAQYADVADQLRAYFDNADLVERMAGPRAADTLPSPGASAVSVTPLAKIRYFGDYQLLDEIARGGMGVVYRARQLSLNRTVALKMILAGHLASESDVRRFYSEAEAAANLDHPGIVPIFEIGQHEGQHYFSMAFIEGTSLAARLAAGLLPPREAAQILKQVAEAVQYAHSQGVIHRDLKPANVLIDKHGNARVTDFGLAKRVQSASDLTGTGQILGTPSYMPPEQAAGKVSEVRETADVYALGAILYEMLTARPPFQADNPIDTLMLVREREPVSPRQLNSKFHIDLETICLKCLEKTRTRRYESADALAKELERFLDGRPILARPVSRPQRVWRWCKRKPVVASLTTALVVAIAMGLIGVRSFWLRAARESDRTRRSSFASQMNLAHTDWEAGNVNAVVERLNLHRPTAGEEDLRSFEWYYLWQLSHAEKLAFSVHDPGHSLDGQCFSRDARELAVGYGPTLALGHGKTRPHVKLFDAATGKVRQTLHQHANVKKLEYSLDGKTLAWVSDRDLNPEPIGDQRDRNRVFIWDLATGSMRCTIEVDSEIFGVALSGDGQKAVIASRIKLPQSNESGLAVYALSKLSDVDNVQPVKSLDLDFQCVTISADGNLIAIGCLDGVKLLDATTFEELETFATGRFLKGVEFSPNNRFLAAHTFSEAAGVAVFLWDLSSKTKVISEAIGGEVADVAFSLNGRMMAAAIGTQLRIWDTDSKKQSVVLKGHFFPVLTLAVAADERTLISLGRSGVVKAWDISNVGGTLPLGIGPSYSGAYSMAFVAGSKMLAILDDRNIVVWDVETETVRVRLRTAAQGVPRAIAVSPDGTKIAAIGDWNTYRGTDAGGTWKRQVYVWSVDSGNVVANFEVECVGDTSHDLFFADDNRIVAAASSHVRKVGDVGYLKLTLLDSGNERLMPSDAGKFLQNADGQRAFPLSRTEKLVRSADGTIWFSQHPPAVILWNGSQGKPTARIPDSPLGKTHVNAFALSRDGRFLAAAHGDGVIRILETQRLIAKERYDDSAVYAVLQGHGFPSGSLEFLPDDKSLVSTGAGVLKVWDIETGAERITLRHPAGQIVSMAVSPDGKIIAAGNQQGVIKLFRAATEKEVRDRIVEK